MKKFFFIVVLVSGILSKAQPIERAEATLLCKFVEHVEWPESRIKIGVMGNSRVLTEMSNLKKKNRLSFYLDKIDFLEEALNFDVIFIPKDQGINVAPLVELIGDKSILLVAENSDIGKVGVDICFIQENSKLRFIINNTIALQKGIKISDTLLDYATEIY